MITGLRDLLRRQAQAGRSSCSMDKRSQAVRRQFSLEVMCLPTKSQGRIWRKFTTPKVLHFLPEQWLRLTQRWRQEWKNRQSHTIEILLVWSVASRDW